MCDGRCLETVDAFRSLFNWLLLVSVFTAVAVGSCPTVPPFPFVGGHKQEPQPPIVSFIITVDPLRDDS